MSRWRIGGWRNWMPSRRSRDADCQRPRRRGPWRPCDGIPRGSRARSATTRPRRGLRLERDDHAGPRVVCLFPAMHSRPMTRASKTSEAAELRALPSGPLCVLSIGVRKSLGRRVVSISASAIRWRSPHAVRHPSVPVVIPHLAPALSQALMVANSAPNAPPTCRARTAGWRCTMGRAVRRPRARVSPARRGCCSAAIRRSSRAAGSAGITTRSETLRSGPRCRGSGASVCGNFVRLICPAEPGSHSSPSR